MDKKQLLIQVLTKLEPDWLPAGGLRILVEQGEMTDKIMDSLISVIKSSASSVENNAVSEKLSKSAALLEKIHAREDISKQTDAAEIAALEEQLNNI